ncbi:MAG: F0F1 ATP synthase subunit A [Candidatus Pacebacteria bacterium]|nr:F0F1 ATP synthase subunit A [Candidatus Paceibacterota bacterium]
MHALGLTGEHLIYGFTNTHLIATLCAVLIFVAFFFGLRGKKLIPSRTQNFFEWIIESIFNFLDGVTGNRERTKEIFPICTTIFIYVMCSNLIELIPGVGVFTPLRSPSSDLTFTFAIAVFSMLYIHIKALSKIGVLPYFGKYINFKNPLYFFIGILEGIGEFTRTFSLGLRLFGNLFAGEMLLMVVSSLIPFIVPLPFLGLEVLVALIQALIFSSLIAIFYVVTVETEEHG